MVNSKIFRDGTGADENNLPEIEPSNPRYNREAVIDGLTGYMVFPSQSAVADALKIRREAFETDDCWQAAVDGVWSICERNGDGFYVAPVEEAENAIAEALLEEEAMLDHYREVGVYEAIQQALWDAAEFSRGDDD